MTFTTEYTDAKELTTEAQALKVKKLIEQGDHDQATAIIAQNSDIINSEFLSVEAELESNSQLTTHSQENKKLLLDQIALGYQMLHLINDGKYNQAGSMLKMFPYLADFKDRQGNTPLHLAMLKEAPKEFIDSIATDKQRFKVANNAGLTPDDTAEGIKFMAIVKELEKNTNPTHSYIKLQQAGINKLRLLNFQDAEGNTPLHKIMHQCEGNTENIMVKNLLADKHRIDLKNKDGFSAHDITQGYQLFRAVAEENTEELNQILEQNPKLVNFKDRQGNTPLHKIMHQCEGNTENIIAKRLLADANRRDLKNKEGLTAQDIIQGYQLFRDVDKENTEEINQILEQNPKLVNFKDKQGNTPLHKIMHLCEGNTQNIIAKRLLADKNRIDIKNKEGFSTQDIIQGYQLLRAMSKPNATAQEINQILEQNPKLVNFKDFEESTPLHQAAYSLNKEIAELLIAKGANINAQNIYGDTAVHNSAIASISDFKETHLIALDMIEFLSNKRANLKLANKDSKTALNIVVESRLEEAEKQEKLLSQENTASTYSTKTPAKSYKDIFEKIIKFIKEITLKISIFKKQEESAKSSNITELTKTTVSLSSKRDSFSPDHTPTNNNTRESIIYKK